MIVPISLWHLITLIPKPGKEIPVNIISCLMPLLLLLLLSHFSHVKLCVTLWTIACKASLPMGFARQEYVSGLPCPSPGDLPDLGMKSVSLKSLVLAQGSLPLVPPGRPIIFIYILEYYLTIKSNEALIHAKMWMNFKNIMLNERIHTQKTHSIWFQDIGNVQKRPICRNRK